MTRNQRIAIRSYDYAAYRRLSPEHVAEQREQRAAERERYAARRERCAAKLAFLVRGMD